MIKLLFLGDIIGKPGRKVVKRFLPGLIKTRQPSVVIANVENAAGGAGIAPGPYEDLIEYGVDVMTSGNHIWDNREGLPLVEEDPLLIRPANYPAGVPGRGSCLFTIPDGRPGAGLTVGVLNLQGRVFMRELDCPFQRANTEIKKLKEAGAAAIFVDIHAEATSEKEALGWYLDGRVSAVVGTHTHVATADSRLLPKGTAYQSDAGMCGPLESVIGVEVDRIIERFLTSLPFRIKPAKGPSHLNGVVIEIYEGTGKATAIERIREVEEG